MNPDEIQEIRLLRQSFQIFKEQVLHQIESFDAELARLEPEDAPSIQFPKDWTGFLSRHAKKHQSGDVNHKISSRKK